MTSISGLLVIQYKAHKYVKELTRHNLLDAK